MLSYVIWDNKKSSDYGLVIERYPDLYLPQQKYDTETVPGRNGDIYFYEDGWENYPRTYEVYAKKETYATLQNTWKKITKWLYVDNTYTKTIDDYINLTLNGYHQLRDSYDEDVVRLATYAGSATVENTVNKIGRAQIDFTLRPERFAFNAFIESLVGTAENDTVSVSYILEEQQNCAKPMIKLSAVSSGDVLRVYNTEQGKSFTITFNADYSGNVYVDCESKNVFTSELSNLNSYITSDSEFPELWEGINTIEYTAGGTTAIYITPRNWTL